MVSKLTAMVSGGLPTQFCLIRKFSSLNLRKFGRNYGR